MERGAKVSGSRFAYRVGAAALLELALYRFALDRLGAQGFDAGAAARARPRGGDVRHRLPPDRRGQHLPHRARRPVPHGHVRGRAGRRSTWARSSTRTRCRSATPATRRASAARPARPARTRAGCSASTSSTRSRCSSSAARRTRRTSTSGCSRSRRRSSPSSASRTASSTSPPATWARRRRRSTTSRRGSRPRQRYREITSTSNTTDFQARRLDIRFRAESGVESLHTLNGTAVTARRMLAILENFQDEGGAVAVPEVLVAFGAPARIEPGA